MPDEINWVQLFRESGVEWVTREGALVYTFKLSRDRKAFMARSESEFWMSGTDEDGVVIDTYAFLKANGKYAVAIRFSAFHDWIEAVVHECSGDGERQ